MVSDCVDGYHGRTELGLLCGGDQGDVSACTVSSVVSKAGGRGVTRVGCAARWSTFGGSTEGARQSLCLARHQGGSSRVAILLLAERIICAVWQHLLLLLCQLG
jgi:hypothetical protein